MIRRISRASICNASSPAPNAMSPWGMISGVADIVGDVLPEMSDLQASMTREYARIPEMQTPSMVQTMSTLWIALWDKTDCRSDTRICPPVRKVKAAPQNIAMPIA